MKTQNVSKSAALVAAGAVVGSAAAVLLHPKTGPDTRRMIKGKIDHARHKTDQALDETKDELNNNDGGQA
jgi:gas vesicle protein